MKVTIGYYLNKNSVSVLFQVTDSKFKLPHGVFSFTKKPNEKYPKLNERLTEVRKMNEAGLEEPHTAIFQGETVSDYDWGTLYYNALCAKYPFEYKVITAPLIFEVDNSGFVHLKKDTELGLDESYLEVLSIIQERFITQSPLKLTETSKVVNGKTPSKKVIIDEEVLICLNDLIIKFKVELKRLYEANLNKVQVKDTDCWFEEEFDLATEFLSYLEKVAENYQDIKVRKLKCTLWFLSSFFTKNNIDIEEAIIIIKSLETAGKVYTNLDDVNGSFFDSYIIPKIQ